MATEQILTVDVDWTSKSGSADSTIAFGEQFTLNIKGMKTESLKQDKHSLRLMLLTQSVPEDDNVVWENGSSSFTVAENGTVIVVGLKINTQAVLDALNQQGGKSRLYLAVTEMDDGAPFTDYGTSRLTVSLGSFIEDPSYDPPEEVDAPKFSDIKNLFDQVKEDIDAISGVETRINAAKEAVEADKVAVATLAVQAQTAASTAISAANSAELSVNSANILATRAETAAQSAQNAAAFAEEMQDEIGATKTKIDATAKVVKSSADAVAGAKKEIDTAISTAQTAITEAVEKAETAKGDAVKAQSEAEASATRAEVALNNGCVYEVRDVADATIGLDKTLTAYKHAPTGDTSYTFNAPQGAEGKIVVFWLWVVIGETAHTLTFPSSVTWLSEPSFAPNTQTLLALMSVDGGATWTANVQWEA